MSADPLEAFSSRWESSGATRPYLLRTYNDEHSKLGRSVYKRTFRLLPTIDHVANEPCDAPVFQVLSWEVNAAKNDMTHESFLELCRKVASRI